MNVECGCKKEACSSFLIGFSKQDRSTDGIEVINRMVYAWIQKTD